jgi:hypothetical protein
VIEIHHVIRILNAAIGARARLHLPDELSALQIRTIIPIKVLAFVMCIVAASQLFTAVFAVRVPNICRPIFEIEFGDRLIRLTLRAHLALWIVRDVCFCSHRRNFNTGNCVVG